MSRPTARWVVCGLLLAALSAAGCSSHSEIVCDDLREVSVPFVGEHYDALLKMKGPPDAKDTLSSGEQVWTYRATKSGSEKGLHVSWGEGVERPVVAWTETVTFVIGADGIIKEFSIRIE